MAKRSFSVQNWTPTATADTTNLANNSYQALQGGSSTQRINVLEVTMGGLGTTSAPTVMTLARDSQVGATTTALSGTANDAPLDASTAALAAPAVPFVAQSGTAPQRSSTLKLLTLAFNAFGGVFRWLAAPGEEITVLGNTASLGELSLSAYTGGTPGPMSSHIIYEPL